MRLGPDLLAAETKTAAGEIQLEPMGGDREKTRQTCLLTRESRDAIRTSAAPNTTRQ